MLQVIVFYLMHQLTSMIGVCLYTGVAALCIYIRILSSMASSGAGLAAVIHQSVPVLNAILYYVPLSTLPLPRRVTAKVLPIKAMQGVQ